MSAENPTIPKDLEGALKLATFNLPPFTFQPKDVDVQRFKTQRFTMRDIGRLKDRLEKVESLTALSLLEREMQSLLRYKMQMDLIVLSLVLLWITLRDTELEMH